MAGCTREVRGAHRRPPQEIVEDRPRELRGGGRLSHEKDDPVSCDARRGMCSTPVDLDALASPVR